MLLWGSFTSPRFHIEGGWDRPNGWCCRWSYGMNHEMEKEVSSSQFHSTLHLLQLLMIHSMLSSWLNRIPHPYHDNNFPLADTWIRRRKFTLWSLVMDFSSQYNHHCYLLYQDTTLSPWFIILHSCNFNTVPCIYRRRGWWRSQWWWWTNGRR